MSGVLLWQMRRLRRPTTTSPYDSRCRRITGTIYGPTMVPWYLYMLVIKERSNLRYLIWLVQEKSYIGFLFSSIRPNFFISAHHVLSCHGYDIWKWVKTSWTYSVRTFDLTIVFSPIRIRIRIKSIQKTNYYPGSRSFPFDKKKSKGSRKKTCFFNGSTTKRGWGK